MGAAGPHTLGIAELVGVVGKPSEHQLRWLPGHVPRSGQFFVAARVVGVPLVWLVGQGPPPAAEDLNEVPKADAEPSGQLRVDRRWLSEAIPVVAIRQLA